MPLERTETFSVAPDDDSLAKEIKVSDGDLIKVGNLTKQGGIRKNWKLRQFKLSVAQLAYYTTDGKVCKGAIPMSMVTNVRAANKGEMGGKGHGLLVDTDKRTFKFQAGSDIVRDEWILAIKAAVKTAQMGGRKKGAEPPARPPVRPTAPGPGPPAKAAPKAGAAAAAAAADSPPAGAAPTAGDTKVDTFGAKKDDYAGMSIYVNAETLEEEGSAPATPLKRALVDGCVAAHRKSATGADGKHASFFVRATFDFEASDTEEISFKKNDILEVIDAEHDEWWLVRLGSSEGHVPSNRVAPVKVDAGEGIVAIYEAVVAQRTGLGVCIEAHAAGGDGGIELAVDDEVQLLEEIGDNFKGRVLGSTGQPGLFPVSCITVKEPIPTDQILVDVEEVRKNAAAAAATAGAVTADGGIAVGMLVRCFQEFEPEAEDELSMVAGDMVEITGIVSDEWANGRKTADPSKEGMFPVVFVRRIVKCVQDFEAEHEDELNLKATDQVEIVSEKDAEWLEGVMLGDDGASKIFPVAFVEPVMVEGAAPAARAGGDEATENVVSAEAPKAEEVPPADQPADDTPKEGAAAAEEAPKEEEAAKEDAPAAEAPAAEEVPKEEEAAKEDAPAAEAPAAEEVPKEEDAAKDEAPAADPEVPKEDVPVADAAAAVEEDKPKKKAPPPVARKSMSKKAPPPVARKSFKKAPPPVAAKKSS